MFWWADFLNNSSIRLNSRGHWISGISITYILAVSNYRNIVFTLKLCILRDSTVNWTLINWKLHTVVILTIINTVLNHASRTVCDQLCFTFYGHLPTFHIYRSGSLKFVTIAVVNGTELGVDVGLLLNWQLIFFLNFLFSRILRSVTSRSGRRGTRIKELWWSSWSATWLSIRSFLRRISIRPLCTVTWFTNFISKIRRWLLL